MQRPFGLSDEGWGRLLCAVAVVVFLSSDTLLVRLVDSDTEELLFWRSLGISVASIVIAAVRVILGHEELKSLTSHWQLVPLGMLWAVNNACFTYAVVLTGSATTLILFATTPCWAAVFSRLFGYRLPWRTVATIGVGICAIGIAVSGGDIEGGTKGIVVGLVGTVSAGLVFSIIHHLYNTIDNISFEPIYILQAIPSCIFALSMGAHPIELEDSLDPLWLALQGLIVVPVAFNLLAYAPQYIPAAEVSLFILLETVLGPFWTYLALEEKPVTRVYIGGAILITAMVLHNYLAWREETIEKKSKALETDGLDLSGSVVVLAAPNASTTSRSTNL